jgi:hypothetical protein
MRRRSTRSLSVFLSLWLATCLLGLVPVRGASGDPRVDDVVGTWKLKCTSPDGKARDSVLVLRREGMVLKGDLWDGKTTRAVRYVAFERGELSFAVDGKYARQVYTVTYKGRPQGDALRGTVHWKYGWASGSFGFVGERIGQRVATIP